MARSRTVLIAGAGIGGLTVALALARAGFRAVVLEQANRLEEVGAGLQLSPNATRILDRLGLTAALAPLAVATEATAIRSARSGREIARIPLGAAAAARYGAPYWVMHRADLQRVLVQAATEHPDITLKLGARVDEFAIHSHGITALYSTAAGSDEEQGSALIAADGVWSALRERLGDRKPLRFARRTAWRAVVAPYEVEPAFRAPVTTLWLGRDAHMVHYPVRAGEAINVVAIVEDGWHGIGWTAEGAREDILRRFAGWTAAARDLVAIPQRWSRWALFDRSPSRLRGQGPVTLLGDAAHPMLPFLAQGAAMAIEDAYVLAEALRQAPDDPATALRHYEAARAPRTARVQREAASNGRVYHLGLAALARNAALWALGGKRLRARYDWLYDWRPPGF